MQRSTVPKAPSLGLKAKKRLINSEIRLVRVYEFISLGLFDITHSHGRMDGWTDGPTDQRTNGQSLLLRYSL